jgi:predicted nuclease of predicted toxin-antitoxin system
VKLLLDQNLSRRMLNKLLPHYPDSSQVAFLEMDKAEDSEIWRYAGQHDFVIVTKDSDFQELSLIRGEPPKVIWLKCGNQSKEYNKRLV